jgi:hypothetical protein
MQFAEMYPNEHSNNPVYQFTNQVFERQMQLGARMKEGHVTDQIYDSVYAGCMKGFRNLEQ